MQNLFQINSSGWTLALMGSLLSWKGYGINFIYFWVLFLGEDYFKVFWLNYYK